MLDTVVPDPTPVDVYFPAAAINDSLLMPEVGNIDTMTLRRSRCTPKSSAIVLDNARQLMEATYSKLRKPIKRAVGLFTMMVLVSVSSLSQTFQHHVTSVEETVANMSVFSQHFGGTINYSHPMALATKKLPNDTFTVKDMLKQDDHLDFIQVMM